ncbi:MAG TPA: class I SAM-dependent methyltransferase [Edaphobacter sp.]|nr:class I SAM-dependent methyltransferase [Edaphobacter sp.]
MRSHRMIGHSSEARTALLQPATIPTSTYEASQPQLPPHSPPLRESPMTPINSETADFNPIARPYRWLEYLALGPTLQRTRLHHLPSLIQQKSALVLGDGDGRFFAHLLTQNPHLQADAVDTSATMLHLLRQRCVPHTDRLQTHHRNALAFNPTKQYDLVVTHFFLDCLTQPELETLIAHITPHLTPRALWLISDFRIPPTGPMNFIARTYIRSLYLAFRILTGLRTHTLPDHATPLTRSGFTRISHHHRLGGLLTTELWQTQHKKT